MKKNIKVKFFSVLAIFSLFIPWISEPAIADGGFGVYDRDMDSWRLQDMKEQAAAINYENGMENMILTINPTELRGEKAVWVFPVPAAPQKTAVDIIAGFPRFSGRDVELMLQNNIQSSLGLMASSQIYPVFPFGMLLVSMGGVRSVDYNNVSVYEHIDKMGLSTELVSAKDGSSLADYLAGKDLGLPPAMKPLLDEYAGKDYSFVVSWISNIDQFNAERNNIDAGNRNAKNNSIGVSIIFPTDKIFFPMKVTGVYESAKIPMLVYVVGHVTPKIDNLLSEFTQTSYYVDSEYDTAAEFLGFFNNKSNIGNLTYTKIMINAPSKYLSDDLWMDSKAPLKISFLYWLNAFYWILGIIIFAAISAAASILAAILTFGRNNVSKKKFALFGQWNFLTLIAVAIQAKRIKIKQPTAELKEKLAREGFTIAEPKGSNFAAWFSFIFILILIGLRIIINFIF